MSAKVISAILLGALVYSTTTQAADNPGSDGSQELHESMKGSMEKMRSMKMSGDTDADFVSMMIEHHRQAIAMSRTAVEHGSSANVKAKAREIIEVSEKDIGALEKLKTKVPQ